MTVRQAVRESLKLLSRRDRRLILLATVLQMATSLLDLAGILLIGLVAALAVTTAEGQSPPQIVQSIFETFGMDSVSPEVQIAVLAGGAVTVLLLKSVVSPLLMARLLAFLASREVLVSSRLSKALLSQPLTFVQRRSSQETAYALIQGTTQATIALLGQVVLALSEMCLLLVLGGALLLIDPLAALTAIAFFIGIAYASQRALGPRMAAFSGNRATADIASLNAVQEAIGAYREIIVADRREFYVDRLKDLRKQAARSYAGQQLSGLLPRYIFEAALAVGSLLLAGLLFLTLPMADAVATLAMFMAAAARVMPSLLRLQYAALSLRASAAAASRTFAIAEDLGYPVADSGDSLSAQEPKRKPTYVCADLAATLELVDVTYTYPGAIEPAVRGVSLSIGHGQFLALVGRSGSGKSTLGDLILGILTPQTGQVTIGSLPPSEAVKCWPGAISYVPQDVMLADASVRANVGLGLPNDVVDDDSVWEALHRAHLAQLIKALPDGLETQIGEGGFRLSGGQRQRLGIARALFTRPRILILDEATSALDAEAERAISETIASMRHEVTTVVIAHRLSTIRQAEIVAYVEDGQIVAQGNFEEVRNKVPSLDRQARLMGLVS